MVSNHVLESIKIPGSRHTFKNKKLVLVWSLLWLEKGAAVRDASCLKQRETIELEADTVLGSAADQWLVMMSPASARSAASPTYTNTVSVPTDVMRQSPAWRCD